jgi:hypothetical protein
VPSEQIWQELMVVAGFIGRDAETFVAGLDMDSMSA